MTQIYRMKDLSELLDQSRIQVRRKIEKLNIKAINENTREYETEPLEYSHTSYLQLAEEFNVSIEKQPCTMNVQASTSDVPINKNSDTREIIEILERELQDYKKIVDKKDEHIKDLNKLLDQQQQLTLMFNTDVEKLNLKIQYLEGIINGHSLEETNDEQPCTTNVQESTSDVQEKKSHKWWNIFRKK